MQLGAFTQASNAESLFDSLAGAFPVPLLINHDAEQALFRVWVGPVESSAQRNQVVSALQAQGVTNYTMVTAGP